MTTTQRGMSDGPPTLEEVAALAGVSRATVSRVVNASPKVSSEVRARVAAAIDELGYVPNRAARSLVTRRTNSIMVVVAEPEDRLFADPFFAGVVRGISGVLNPRDLQLVLMLEPPDRGPERIVRYATQGHVDGVLLLSLHGNDPLPGRLHASGVPVVVGGRPSDPEVSHVDADNVRGARTAVEHLFATGASTIATITGPLDMAVGQDRLDGYRAALEAAGRTVDDSLEVGGDFTEAGGEAAMRDLLDARPDLDAVFAASDLMAAGALRALAAAGRRVPDDVGVVGFDDSVVARSCVPPLTSVRQPVARLGAEMAHVLLSRLEDPGAHPRAVLLPTDLVVRGSTRPR